MTGAARFQYQLDSLLKKRGAERDEQLHERAGAQHEVEQCRVAFQAACEEVMRLEQLLRGVASFGKALDLDEQARARDYLRDCRDQAAERRVALDQAEDRLTAIEARLRVTHESIRTLERHRDGQRQDFEAQWRRREQGLMDELWLLHEGNKQDSN